MLHKQKYNGTDAKFKDKSFGREYIMDLKEIFAKDLVNPKIGVNNKSNNEVTL